MRVILEVAAQAGYRLATTDWDTQIDRTLTSLSGDSSSHGEQELLALCMQRLAAHKTNLARYELRRVEYGILVPPELENLIAREQRAIEELNRRIDELQGGECGRPVER